MKRRNFLFLCFGFTTQLFSKTVIWAVKGKQGYSDKAPAHARKFKKSCDTCKFLFRDEKIKGAGLCRQPAIISAAASEDVHVKKSGWCNLWQKDG